MYESDVTIQCHFNYARELENCLSDNLKHEMVKRKISNSFIYSWNDMNWTESRDDVCKVMDLLDRWHEKGVSHIFVRIGNDVEDITFSNENVYDSTLLESPCRIKRFVTMDID